MNQTLSCCVILNDSSFNLQTGFSNSFEIAMMRVGMTFAALAMIASTVSGETWARAGPTGPQGPQGPAGVTGS
jgi:hypothetical protein